MHRASPFLTTQYVFPVNTSRQRQKGRHFPDDIFKWISLNENVWISIIISLKFVPKGSINNISSLVQIMAWRRRRQTTFSNRFSGMKIIIFRFKFHWRLFRWVQLQNVVIVPDNGLAPMRRHAWSNDDPVYWRIYASFGPQFSIT